MDPCWKHPFTAIVAGPTGCGKTMFTFKFIREAKKMINPAPDNIVYCYGEYQQIFNNYPYVTFSEGLPDISQFDGKRSSLLIIDDLLTETNDVSIKFIYESFTPSKRLHYVPFSESVLSKQTEPHNEFECPLHSPIQKSARCDSGSRFGSSNVSRKEVNSL
jgi:hypothetical protein